MNENEKAFMIGLEKLTRETGVIIHGCGCCSSPSLDNATKESLESQESGYGFGYADQVVWIGKDDDYEFNTHGESIVK